MEETYADLLERKPVDMEVLLLLPPGLDMILCFLLPQIESLISKLDIHKDLV